MLTDPAARALWRQYRERVLTALRALPRRERTDLIEDLDAHVREGLRARRGADATSERDCVATIIEQLGPPETQFHALSSAWSSLPQHSESMRSKVRTRADAAWACLGYMATFAGGALLALMAFLRLLAPAAAGIFESAAGQYQVRLLGLGREAGEQILPIWMAFMLVFIGGAGAGWGFEKLRGAAARLMRHISPRSLSRVSD